VLADRRLDAQRAKDQLLVSNDTRKQDEHTRKMTPDELFRLVVSSLDSSTNVASTISTTSFGDLHKFLDPWKKYGPQFISRDDVELITERIGIDELNKRIERRLVARRAKRFAESDLIRDELGALGIVLKDSKDSTSWEVVQR
jgi:cysteinyl-tRNA synthetase